jgi:nitrate reductase NapE component
MKVRDSDILAWVQGQRKSQVLGAFGLLDFTMLWPVLAWHVCFETYKPFISLIFQFIFGLW